MDLNLTITLGVIFMKRESMAKDEERVCIMLNREQKKMLVQIADDERKSYSSILRDGLELYWKNHIERRKVLSEYGL